MARLLRLGFTPLSLDTWDGGGALIGSLQKVDRPVGRRRPASPLVGDGFNMLAEASGYWTTTLAVCGCTTETVRIVLAGS